jgi:hypothetical protein
MEGLSVETVPVKYSSEISAGFMLAFSNSQSDIYLYLI